MEKLINKGREHKPDLGRYDPEAGLLWYDRVGEVKFQTIL